MLDEMATSMTVDDAVRQMLGARIDDAYRLATFILHDSLAAEDAVQEAALIAWRRRRTLRDEAAADGWFSRIVVNSCRDELRRRARRPHVVPLDLEVRGTSRLASATERAPGPATDLGSAIRLLTPDEQALLALRFGQDLTVPQIAARLEVAEGTIKSRLHATMQHLRAALDAERRSEEATR